MALTNDTIVTAADIQITGVLDMQKNQITGLNTDLALYPIYSGQAATKKYVDATRDGIVAGLPTLVNNGEY